MVFQSYALYPHMSVRDNLAFGLKLRKVPKSEIDKRISEAAGILQLEKLLDRKPKELSGGQRQRVALGRAIVREPAVFLMDEPLSNLDAKLRVQTRAEIARLHQRLGTTMVYVTHDQVEAMTMGQRIAVMSEGLLQQVGTPQELYDHPDQPVRRRLHRQPVDELRRGCRSPTARRPSSARARSSSRSPAAYQRGPRGARATRSIVGLPPGAPRARRRSRARGATIQGTADVVEYLGNEELLHVTVGRHTRSSRSSTRRTGSARATSSRSGCRPTSSTCSTAETGLSLVRHPRGRRRGLTPPPQQPTAGASPGGPAVSLRPGAEAHDPAIRSQRARRRERGRSISGRYLEFRVDTIERADGSRGTRDVVGHPGAIAVARARRRRTACCSSASGASRRAGRCSRSRPARSTSTTASPRTRTSPRGASSRRRPAIARRAWRKLGRVLDRARVRDRADAPLPRDGHRRASDGDDRLAPDEDERLELRAVPLDEAVGHGRRGEISDAKSILGILWLDRLRRDEGALAGGLARADRGQAGERGAG